jgi:hypothetical protein
MTNTKTTFPTPTRREVAFAARAVQRTFTEGDHADLAARVSWLARTLGIDAARAAYLLAEAEYLVARREARRWRAAARAIEARPDASQLAETWLAHCDRARASDLAADRLLAARRRGR